MKVRRKVARWWVHGFGYALMAVAGYRYIHLEGGMSVWEAVGIAIFFLPGLMLAFPNLADRTLSTIAPYFPFIEVPDEDEGD